MTRPSPRIRASGHLALPLLLVLVVAGACTDDGFDWGSAIAGAGQDGDRPTQAPPAPQDPGQAFDDAIEATRSVESAALVIEMQVGSESLDFDGELASTDVGRVVADSNTGREMELRSDGETAWLRVDDPAVTAELPDGVRWVEGSYDELREIGVLHGLEEAWEILPILRGIASVDDLGVGDVAGVPVRRLRGDVDFEAALDAATSDERSALEDAIRLDGSDPDIVAEVALDGDGRVRSLHLDFEVGGDIGLGTSMTLDYEMRAFNQTVPVPEPPPAGETVPLDDVPGVVDLLLEGL